MKLDLALQSSRVAFAHWDEEQVFEERLRQKNGIHPVRSEIRLLAQSTETWLEGAGVLDAPVLIRKARDQIESEGWPETLVKPEAIYWLSAQTPESLELSFWEALQRWVDVRRIGPEDLLRGMPETKPQLHWRRWHTLDDAAEAMSEELARSPRLSDHAILIPDSAEVRRSMKRALGSYDIPLADPRDPTRLRWDEGLKWALLPLEVVAQGYERSRVMAWLRSHQNQDELPSWLREINIRGVRNGLGAYSGGVLSGVHSRLEELNEDFGGRKSCADLAEAHLRLLRVGAGTDAGKAWVVPFLERVWKTLEEDMALVGRRHRKAPLLYWLERFNARVADAPAPVERLKPVDGIATYRLHQMPVVTARRVWLLGLPANWLGAPGPSDSWYC